MLKDTHVHAKEPIQQTNFLASYLESDTYNLHEISKLSTEICSNSLDQPTSFIDEHHNPNTKNKSQS